MNDFVKEILKTDISLLKDARICLLIIAESEMPENKSIFYQADQELEKAILYLTKKVEDEGE